MENKFLLWENAPGLLAGEEIPILTYYPSDKKATKATVVICPGGGYRLRAPHEGEGYAKFLNAAGYDAFVVDYRVAPYRFPYPLLDARRAIRFVRHNAEKFDIDPNRIAIMGSSAGGHLSALLSTYRAELEDEGADEIDNESYLPSAQILCYPVIDRAGHFGSYENLLGPGNEEMDALVNPALIADEATPKCFLWHTNEDKSVDVCNSYRYVARLKELGVPVEMHIFPYGRHGLGLAPGEEHDHLRKWADLMLDWLKLIGFACD